MKAYYRETENSIFKNLLWLHCYGAGVDGDWSYIEQDDQGSRPRHNTVSQKLDKLQLPWLGRAGVSRPELNCDNSLRSSHQTSSPLQSSAEKSSRPTLNVIVILLQYFNSNTVTFIYWFIYLMIIRRRYLFSNKTSQNIHVKSIVLQYILLLWRPLLPDEDPGRSLNPLETGWYPKKVPEPGPGCCWCRHTVTDAWWCVTAPCNDRLLFSSGPNWISWTR